MWRQHILNLLMSETVKDSRVPYLRPPNWIGEEVETQMLELHTHSIAPALPTPLAHITPVQVSSFLPSLLLLSPTPHQLLLIHQSPLRCLWGPCTLSRIQVRWSHGHSPNPYPSPITSMLTVNVPYQIVFQGYVGAGPRVFWKVAVRVRSQDPAWLNLRGPILTSACIKTMMNLIY